MDEVGAHDLGLGSRQHLTLAYAGQAGATKWPSGARSDATLLSRITSQHLGGWISSSTLRQTLAALLRDALELRIIGPKQLDAPSEQRLTHWMKSRLHATVWPHDDRDQLSLIERHVITALDAPLNLLGADASDLRGRITRGRRALKVFEP